MNGDENFFCADVRGPTGTDNGCFETVPASSRRGNEADAWHSPRGPLPQSAATRGFEFSNTRVNWARSSAQTVRAEPPCRTDSEFLSPSKRDYRDGNHPANR